MAELSGLVVIEPDTLEQPSLKTQYKILYTDEGLYVGFWNEQDPETFIARLGPRDDFMTRDEVSFTLDPTGQGLYGYWFGVAMSGSLMDGTVLPERQFSDRWDGPWRGAAAQHQDGWTAEMFLPWSMMSMPEAPDGKRQMGYYISRAYATRNERWAYPALPRSSGIFMSRLQPIEMENVNPSQQFTFYPYGSTTYDNLSDVDVYKAGFDIFWRPSTNLQLASTINPDFGNVETDSIVVNLTSFETFFSEKRPFFLEGQDVFVTSPRNLGSFLSIAPTTTLVNTRRIGSAPRSVRIDGFSLSALERNQPTELAAAAKVTGQFGRLRYGVLAAVEDDTELSGTVNGAPLNVIQAGRDFGIARMLFEDTRSSRRSIGWMTTMVAHPDEDAMVHGIDGHYLSTNSRFAADGQLMYSDVGDRTGRGGFIDFRYTPRQGHQHKLQFDYFGENLDISDLGFLRGNDAKGMRYSYERSSSKHPGFKSVFSQVIANVEYNLDGRRVDNMLTAWQEFRFHNNQFIFYQLSYMPERWDDRNSGGNGDFRIDDRWQTWLQWGNSRAAKMNVKATYVYTDEDIGGSDHQYELRLTWRPIDQLGVELRTRYNDRDGWLLHSGGGDFTTYEAEVWAPQLSVDYFLTATQQFRLSAQWAGIKAFEQDRWLIAEADGYLIPDPEAPTWSRDFSLSRLSFQARYRWEIAPLSDLFLVYTRGSNLPSDPAQEFSNLLRDAWSDRIVDRLVVKLRYRMGS